jgi:predicted dehydrogenase
VCEELGRVGDIDNAVVNLRYASGAIGNVELSRNAFYGYDIRTEVLGSEGGVVIGGYQHTPVLLLTRSGAQHDITPYLMERFGPAYRSQIEHFVDCVQHGRRPDVGGADALAAFEIALAATRAYQTGQSTGVGDGS